MTGTTFLLIDSRVAETDVFVRDWLGERGYLVRTAADAVDAVDGIIDFTTGTRPDVVLLTAPISSSSVNDLRRVLKFSCSGEDHAIVALSSGAPTRSTRRSVNLSLERIFGANLPALMGS